MRILVINSEYPPVGGGAGNASANLARCLAAFGHTVTVLTAGYEGLPTTQVEHGVSVHRVRGMRRWLDRSSAYEQAAFILSALPRALALARETKPDAVLAFFGMPSGAIAWVLKKIHRIPYVVSLRGGDVPGFRPYDFKLFHKVIGPFLRIIWREAAAVVANSRGLQALALKFDSRRDIPIIPNGVDSSLYVPERRDWSSSRLFSVGRVVYQKGLDIGLRALAQLKDLEWEWWIAGDGPQLQPLQALAEELAISDRVKFLGWQSRQDLDKWYHASTLFLFPSRHEGMPNAVLEAMASGLPVLATRIAGNEELVVDGETGMLVSTEDVDSLREGLRTLLGQTAKREEMGRAARARVEREYTWENAARQYADILEKLA